LLHQREMQNDQDEFLFEDSGSSDQAFLNQ